MAIGNLQIGTPKQFSATANLKADQGVLLGIFVSSSTSGTIAIYDSATTTTTTLLVNTFTGAAATWYPLPIAFSSGLYIVVGGTIQATAVYA